VSSAGTGAVGTVTLGLLRERGFENVRVFASARSAGRVVDGPHGRGGDTRSALRGDVDIFLFSVGTGASRELVPHRGARRGGSRSTSPRPYRLEPGIPLVVPEVNGGRALENDGIRREPELLHDPAHLRPQAAVRGGGLARVRVATYPVGCPGAGAQAMERLRGESPDDHDLRMDWEFDGEEFDEESKLRRRDRKIMELPDLPLQATCVRVPVMVGHAEAVWLETEQPLSAERATEILARAPSVRVEDFPSPGKATGIDEVLVGRIRRDPTVENGLAPLHRERQPAQGRGPERDPDRRPPPRRRHPRRPPPNPPSDKLSLGSGAREVAAFVPDCAVLYKRLLGDARCLAAPSAARRLDRLSGAAVRPDPGFIPVLGQLDDALVVAATMAYVTRSAGRALVIELWPGSDAGLRAVLALAPT